MGVKWILPLDLAEPFRLPGRVQLSGRGPAVHGGRDGGCRDTGQLPTALPCRSVSTTSWRCAVACPQMPGCTAGSVAPRRPRSSPHRATICVWSSSQTTRSPNAASGPTSSQVCRFGGQAMALRTTGLCWLPASGPPAHPCLPAALPSQYFHSKSPGWLSTTEMYSLPFWGPEVTVWARPCPLKALGEDPSVPFPSLWFRA